MTTTCANPCDRAVRLCAACLRAHLDRRPPHREAPGRVYWTHLCDGVLTAQRRGEACDFCSMVEPSWRDFEGAEGEPEHRAWIEPL